MNTNEKEPISIRYLDKQLYTKLCRVAEAKGCTSNKKTDIFDFIFKDYISMHELDEFRNPYLLKAVQQIISSCVDDSEKRLGNRLFKTVAECSLNLSIMNQIIYSYMNKFSDDEESMKYLKEIRERAVEELRENKLMPLTYIKLVKDDE